VLHCAFLPAVNHFDQSLARSLRRSGWGLRLRKKKAAGEKHEDKSGCSK
jgi:hypothetical protein